MTYLLDTNICIHALKQHPGVLTRLLQASRPEVMLSVITEAELRTGAAKSTSAARTLRLLENFLAPLTVLDFVSADAVAYAHLRAALKRAGTPIGPLDTLIAAQARARDLTLVSSNEREFRRVSGLRVENWAT
jgi:tRNA(fMet)-specific endonuclease VapC